MIHNCNGTILLEKNHQSNFTADFILKKITTELHNIDQETIRNGFEIDFQKKIHFTTHTGQNKLELFKILRKGKIKLEDQKNHFSLKFYIYLDNFLFSIILLFLILFFFNRLFTDNNIFLSIFYPFVISAVIYFTGYKYVKNKIKNIILKTKYY